MATLNEFETVMKAPLEQVVNRWYPAPFMRWLYEESLQKVAAAHPTRLPQPDSSQLSGREKTPVKAYLSVILIAVLRDQELGRQFFEALPRNTRDLLTKLTWARDWNLARLEAELGFQLVLPGADSVRAYSEPFLIPTEFGFFLIRPDPPDRSWYYRNSDQRSDKKGYAIALPREVRARFREFVPPPPGFDLIHQAELPEAGGLHYDCAAKVIEDLRLVAEFIEQGHLKYTKSERVATPSLRSILQMLGGTEFFPASRDPELSLLRTRLLSDGTALVGSKARAELLARPGVAEPARAICLTILSSAAILHEQVLAHLDNAYNSACRYDPAAVAKLAAFFGRLPGGQWVSWENIATYHTLRDEIPTLFQGEYRGLYSNTRRGEFYSPGMYLSEADAFELLGAPLLKGYAFLMAALGMAEIVYGFPESETYRFQSKPYLTRFDGLRHVRLTSWGEYVLGRRSTYEVQDTSSAKAVLMLDESRLLVTCRDPDPLTELALGRLLERLAPGRYCLTANSLLAGCQSGADVEERVRLFRRVVSASPPPIWEDFFTRTLARMAPLTPEPDYLVLKLSGDEELRRHVATDPVLRGLVLKVEGLRIAVRRDDFWKLTKRLERFGYFSPTR